MSSDRALGPIHIYTYTTGPIIPTIALRNSPFLLIGKKKEDFDIYHDYPTLTIRHFRLREHLFNYPTHASDALASKTRPQLIFMAPCPPHLMMRCGSNDWRFLGECEREFSCQHFSLIQILFGDFIHFTFTHIITKSQFEKSFFLCVSLLNISVYFLFYFSLHKALSFSAPVISIHLLFYLQPFLLHG